MIIPYDMIILIYLALLQEKNFLRFMEKSEYILIMCNMDLL